MEIDELTARLRQTTSFDSVGGLYRPLLRLPTDGQRLYASRALDTLPCPARPDSKATALMMPTRNSDVTVAHVSARAPVRTGRHDL